MKKFITIVQLILAILVYSGCENETRLHRIIFPEDDAGTIEPVGTIVPDLPDKPTIIDLIPDGGPYDGGTDTDEEDSGPPPSPEPDIEVTPLNENFGDVLAGCWEETEIIISNVGDAQLEISLIIFSASSDLQVDYDFPSNGPFPWYLNPATSKSILIEFAPMDELDDLSYLTVYSNDPDEGTLLASQQGVGYRESTVIDSWIQTEITKTDILFVVDNSGSMNQEQVDIATHASDFINALDSLTADYQIAVITTDNATFVGPVIDSTSATRVTDLSTQIVVGTSGSAYERGLYYAELATSLGGDATAASGFIRTDSLLNIIFVSDEDDWSTGTVSDYISHFESLKTYPDDLMLHAVVGDAPSGCGSAGVGTRYLDAQITTGGLFYSICSTTWGTNLQNLANGSTTSRSNFYLTEVPIEDSLIVEVEGVTVSTWTYDAVANTVIFDPLAVPSEGEQIDITYGTFGDCDEDDTGDAGVGDSGP